MRLFLAITPPPPVRHALLNLQPPPHAKLKPSRDEQLHLTLHFLGNSDPDALHKLLTPVKFTSFDIEINHLGSFGGKQKNGVLWAGFAKCNALEVLQQKLATGLGQQIEVSEMRNYKPHITLARSRPGYPATALNNFLAQFVAPLKFTVTEFALYNSITHPCGAQYLKLASYPAGLEATTKQ